uniref:Papilin-like protein n=1 Tax=Tetranychus truncatus TaxID=93132 RepID=A0A3G5APV3_9ACAR|nr:papilin-like protein [Tetranychus truncatus]
MYTKMVSLYFFVCINSLVIYVNSRSINTPAVCKLAPQPGPCYSYNPRYFFNDETETCELFIYGGCQGNGNNFETQKDCMSLCSLTSSVPLRRSTRDAENSADPSSDPNSEQATSNKTLVITAIEPSTNTTEPARKREDICFQPFAEGTCKENLIRYYYDPEVNKCIKFIFKGCFQYDNNFEKLEDCESLCVIPDKQSR